MPERGFIRFNLHKMGGLINESVDIFDAYLTIGKEKIQEYIDEVNNMQKERAMRLRDKYADDIDRLKNKKVLFIGDSITSDRTGYRMGVTEATSIKMIDCSISGAVTSTIFFASRDSIAYHKPDIVSIMIGSNDVVSMEKEEYNQVGINEYERNISKIAEWATQSRAKLIMMEIPKISEKKFNTQYNPLGKQNTNAMIDKYNKIVDNVAQKQRAALVRNDWMKDNVEKYVDDDGIHLNDNGHEILSHKWIEGILTIV